MHLPSFGGAPAATHSDAWIIGEIAQRLRHACVCGKLFAELRICSVFFVYRLQFHLYALSSTLYTLHFPSVTIESARTHMSLDATNTFCVPSAPPETEPITLRRATLADAPALALVGAATFLEAFTWMLPGADIIAHCLKNHTPVAYAAYLAHPDTRITLAVTGADAPVGFAMLCVPELPSITTTAADIELKRIYLFSRFRSETVTNAAGTRPAQALMDAAVADALAQGRQRLLLGTHENNLRAIAFYRRNGFVEVGKRMFQVGSQQCCDLIFAKAL